MQMQMLSERPFNMDDAECALSLFIGLCEKGVIKRREDLWLA